VGKLPRKRRSIALVAGASAAALLGWLSTTMLAASPALGTTTDTVGLPAPKKVMGIEYGTPYLGRFVLSRVGRSVHVRSALLDVAVESQLGPKWLYGEIGVGLYVHGKPSTTRLPVYNFQYHNGHVSAELLAPSSVSEQHPRGVALGRLSFLLPRGAAGIGNKAKELETLTGTMTIEGHTVNVRFHRVSLDGAPPNPVPKAKQT
jgi:hypothetical protein